jgi:hypothetical protein
MPTREQEVDIAYALEAVPSVVGAYALALPPSAVAHVDAQPFGVLLRPYTGESLAAAHLTLLDASSYEVTAWVSEEDFRLVRTLLRRPREGQTRRVAVPGYLLHGLIRCGACGGTMSPTSTQRGKGEYRYYRCLTRHKKGPLKNRPDGPTGCNAKPIPAKAIESFVIERLRGALGNTKLVADVVGAMRDRVAKTAAVHTTEKTLLVEKIADVSSRVTQLMDLPLLAPDIKGDPRRGGGARPRCGDGALGASDCPEGRVHRAETRMA